MVLPKHMRCYAIFRVVPKRDIIFVNEHHGLAADFPKFKFVLTKKLSNQSTACFKNVCLCCSGALASALVPPNSSPPNNPPSSHGGRRCLCFRRSPPTSTPLPSAFPFGRYRLLSLCPSGRFPGEFRRHHVVETHFDPSNARMRHGGRWGSKVDKDRLFVGIDRATRLTK